MITNEKGYQVTLDAIKREKEALKRTRHQLKGLDKCKLRIVESGSLSAIAEMEREVCEYERTRFRKAS
jgi:hypothetical protein